MSSLRLLPLRSRSRSRHAPRLRRRRLYLESLEQRRVLATYFWDGGGDGIQWNDPLNWSEDTIPGAADDAIISGAQVRGPGQARNLTLNNASVTLEGPTLTGQSVLSIWESVTLNDGTIFVSIGGVLTFRSQTGKPSVGLNHEINGSGEIVFIQGGPSTVSPLITFNHTGTLPTLPVKLHVGAGIAIRGGTSTASIAPGNLGEMVRLVNHGLIQTDSFGASISGITVLVGLENTSRGIIQAAEGRITIGRQLNNSGTVEATGGLLEISGNYELTSSAPFQSIGPSSTLRFGSGRILNPDSLPTQPFVMQGGGTIEVGLGSVFDNEGNTLSVDTSDGVFRLGGTLRGGVVTGPTGSSITAGGGTLDGVTANLNLDLTPTGLLNVANDLTLNRTATIGQAALRFAQAAPQSLLGNGQIVLLTPGTGTAGSGSEIRQVGGNVLTVGPGITIRGRGTVGAVSGAGTRTLINQGVISADTPGGATTGGASLRIQANTTTNQGVFESRNGARLQADTPTTMTNLADGTLTGGTWRVFADSSIHLAGPITTNTATVVLDGPNSRITRGAPTIVDALTGLANNTSTGQLTVRNGRQFTTTVSFANAGQVHIGEGSTLTVDANAQPGLDTITFSIHVSLQTISLLSELPTITDPIIVDGTTQPGYAGTPLIELNGSSAGTGVVGLRIRASDSVVKGLVINRFSSHGIQIENGASGNIIVGNYLGTNPAGTAALANLGSGISITTGASNNRIGGTGTGERNLISGNSANGIIISGNSTANNVVVGNHIGTNAAGTAAIPHTDDAIYMNGALGVVIGGTTLAARNVLSGNNGDGVEFSNSSGIVLQGNYIGTDVTGSYAIPNRFYGVRVPNSSGALIADNVISGNGTLGLELWGPSATNSMVTRNLIGVNAAGDAAVPNGTAAGNIGGVWIRNGASHNVVSENVISGNRGQGVLIEDSSTRNNRLEGNRIGTDLTGSFAVPNTTRGVQIQVGASQNHIGGDAPGAGNLISGNDGVGVQIVGVATANNVVAGNLIGTDISGTRVLGNAFEAVRIDNASNNILGGTLASAGNLISGGRGVGVRISGSATGNSVLGNLIGTDITGTAALGNNGNGILIHSGASDNWIGSGLTGARNVISGNGLNGIRIADETISRNRVMGNYIGTNAAGTAPLANTLDGVLVASGAKDTRIGTDGDGTNDDLEGNLISGNVRFGVHIRDIGTDRTIVAGNTIGLNKEGTAALPNAGRGIYVLEGAKDTRIGTDADGVNDRIERNVISGNGEDGVRIVGANTVGTVIAGNFIGTDVTGTVAIGNTGVDIRLANQVSGNHIGGNSPGAGNVIGGNLGSAGVFIVDSSDNVIAGNHIGVDVTGELALPNAGRGIEIRSGSQRNQVGTDADSVADEAERNVISGNGGPGIMIWEHNTSYNVVAGNYIGTNASGTAPLGNAHGISIFRGATANTIGGNAVGTGNLISGNNATGVQIFEVNTANNWVMGNYIGTDVTGTQALGNGTDGVFIHGGASGNVVGANSDGVGDTTEGNLISGNGRDGIWITGPGTNHNVVAGNIVGLNVSGTGPLGNRHGIVVQNGARFNRIGTDGDGVSDAAERNISSGNRNFGVLIGDPGTAGNVIAGNYLGTDVTGMLAVPNLNHGIVIAGSASGNRIGTDGSNDPHDINERNVISGNAFFGVSLDVGAMANVVAGNFIGVSADGAGLMPNGWQGVAIGRGSSHNRIGTNGDGIADAIEANVIAHNAFAGVWVYGATSTGNSIRGNSIFANGGLGIDLSPEPHEDGVTLNDHLDADSGPNGLVNFPTIVAVLPGAETRIRGTYHGRPSASFLVEFFTNEVPDPSGFGEGQTFLGTAVVATNAQGNATFDVLLPEATAPGQWISATATDFEGNTSEFSAAIAVDNIPPQILELLPVIPNPRNIPVEAIDMVFSEELDLETFDLDDVLLAVNGQPLLLAEIPTLEQLTSTTYRLGNLHILTGSYGSYELTVDATGVRDLAGNPGIGVLTISWLMDTVAPVSRVNPLPQRAAGLEFEVSVSGTDPALTGLLASGIVSYDVHVAVRGRQWRWRGEFARPHARHSFPWPQTGRMALDFSR